MNIQERKNACLIIGHRIFPIEEKDEIFNCLNQEILLLLQNGIHDFYLSTTNGFDALAAQCLFHLKKEHALSLCLVLPFPSSTDKWKLQDQQTHQYILSHADQTTYIAQQYRRGIMQQQSRFVADQCNICLCYLTKQHGHTAYTVQYYKKQGSPS